MMSQPRRVALMLDLEWPHKRHAGIFTGIQQYARQHDWETAIDEYVDERLSESPAKSLPYDGVIGRATEPLARHAAALGLPIVNIWFSSPVRKRLSGVFPDFAACGRLRAEHLLQRGLRRFAVLGREDQGTMAEVAAFRARLAEAGHSCHAASLPLHPTRTYSSWKKSEQRISDWMSDWQTPIGVFVGTEDVGRMVVQLCLTRGWRVPEDVALITGWNEQTLCEHPRPSLSSVELGYERIGFEAAQLLGRLMNKSGKGKKRRGVEEPPEHIVLPPVGLVVRESTDFFAVDDPQVTAALEFIAANSHRPIAPEDVARAVGLDRRSLHDRFRSSLDRPIAAEKRRVRIERAKRELEQGDRRLSQIARDVGFGRAMRMYEVFRREVGSTPSEYRKARQMKNSV